MLSMVRKLVAVIFVVVVYNLFFYRQFFPFPGTIAFLLLIFSLHAFLWTAFFPKTFSEKHRLAGAATFLSLLMAAISVFRASEVDLFVFFFASLGLSLISLYFLALRHREFGAVSEFVSMPFVIAMEWIREFFLLCFERMPGLLGWLGAFFRHSGKPPSPRRRLASGVIRGLLLAGPVVLVITVLLRAADPIFTQMTDRILKLLPKLQSDVLRRIVESISITVLVTPMALLAVRRKFVSPLLRQDIGRLRVEALTMVGLIAMVLTAFLVIQFRYLFATVPEVELQQFGVMTYSEYVRRGFVELIVVSVIVYLVANAGYLIMRATQAGEGVWLKRMNLALLAEILIFVVSIYRRVSLYQMYHGLTRIRIYGSVFLVVLVALTAVLILRHLWTGVCKWYRYEAGIIVGGVLLIACLNPDRLIATTFPPTVNGEVDEVYIARLSASAVEGWLEAYQAAERTATQYRGRDPLRIFPDETRKLIYTQRSLQALRSRYRSLIGRYGSAGEYEQIEYRDSERSSIPTALSPRPTLWVNLAELAAYRKLSFSVPPSALVTREEEISTLLEAIPKEHYPESLDRSSNTPLL